MPGIDVGDIVGDYEVVGVLGRGGMGKVFRVRSRLTDREEAMKVVYPDLSGQTELAERFLREIKVHASLDHPNIAALRAAVRVQDQLVMILELVHGFSLEERLRAGVLPPAEAVHYINQVLSALAFAHARGVVHRDIKPANILITTEQVVKLTDFGIARAAKDQKLTNTGFALGSLPYMSPEQIQSEAVDPRSDIYSLGVTCYEAVTGVRPFRGENEYALMNAHLTGIPKTPSEVAPIPVLLSDAIMKALAKNPRDRFQSTTEFQAALRQLPDAPAQPIPAFPQAGEIPPEDLARIESSLVRVLGPIARHVVKDAARRFSSVSELCQSLAEQIPQGREREAFLKSSLGTGTASPSKKATTVVKTDGPRAWDEAWLARLELSLAAYIGPIAKVIVKRATKSASTPDDLCRLLAAEISSEADRQRFLSAARQ